MPEPLTREALRNEVEAMTREPVEKRMLALCVYTDCHCERCDLEREAAAEIERLRQRVRELEKLIDCWGDHDQDNALERLKP